MVQGGPPQQGSRGPPPPGMVQRPGGPGPAPPPAGRARPTGPQGGPPPRGAAPMGRAQVGEVTQQMAQVRYEFDIFHIRRKKF